VLTYGIKRKIKCFFANKLSNTMNSKNIIDIGKNAMKIELDALSNGMNSLGEEFAETVSLIAKKNLNSKIIFSGTGKSGHVCRKLAATFSSTGTVSIFLHPTEACHGDLGVVNDGDIFIAITQSGNNLEIESILPFLNKLNIKKIIFTGNKNAAMTSSFDYVINTSIKREACSLNLAPTASTTLAMAIGDAMAVAVMSIKNFSDHDFALSHPAGTLGKKLTLKVKDVMSEISIAPLVNFDTSLYDALLEMNKVGMGILIIKDRYKKVIGIYTDGDLRRTLTEDHFNKDMLISDVMNDNFKTVHEDDLAINAVNKMRLSKINALPVINSQDECVGAINLRQLLQSKVI